MLERTPELYGLNKVMFNAEEMLFMAVRYLAHYGHRRIIYIAHDCAYDIEKKRLAGFNSGMTAMGVAAESEFVGIDSYTGANGYRALKEYIARRGLPSAIIAADQVLMGALSYLYEQGLRAPDAVSMVGLDDTFAQYASPPLTSVAFPVAEIARSTLRILNEAHHERTLPQSLLLSTLLIEHSSVAAPEKQPVKAERQCDLSALTGKTFGALERARLSEYQQRAVVCHGSKGALTGSFFHIYTSPVGGRRAEFSKKSRPFGFCCGVPKGPRKIRREKR